MPKQLKPVQDSKKISKKLVQELMSTDVEKLHKLLKNGNNHETGKILKYLGRISSKFDGDILLPFLSHQNHVYRYFAVKNIGKLKNPKYLNQLVELYKKEKKSKIKREIVSAIGRMKSRVIIPILIDFLNARDPKILLQCIRALIQFIPDKQIETELKKLENHPNEMVQDAIDLIFNSKKGKTAKTSHPKSPNFMKNVVVKGDVRPILKITPEESIHLTFTSPPYYNARDYSIYQSYSEYIDFLTSVFKEVHRITKEGRFFILNTSPIIIPRWSRSTSSKRYPIPFDIHNKLVNMGWEFIDDIIWLKPEASVKNRNAGFLQHRKPVAYKPNPVTEYLMVYRKKTRKLIDWNIHQYDKQTIDDSKVLGDYETSNVWKIDPVSNKVHSAVFPFELCEKVIKYYSFRHDLVFDPFAGSGTFGKAALKFDRYFFLTEIKDIYIQDMKKSLNYKLFDVNISPRFINYEEFKTEASKVEKNENRR